ncbi:uncharacterized protein BDV14DRAFT_175560 [Aspergillus stella-maris]|uniref:uncharacterized protein n=1 Tax=Aspergillus stella-maris TaxID=1810926 RepID=UPI003CCD7151
MIHDNWDSISHTSVNLYQYIIGTVNLDLADVQYYDRVLELDDSNVVQNYSRVSVT